MIIETAEKAGTCYGVKRALELARTAAQRGGNAHTLGPLIHNPRVVDELAACGMSVAETLDEAGDGILVLRSHGSSPETIEEAYRRGFDVVDATCPFVSKVQQCARKLGELGYGVVIIGEAGHAEVESIRAWGGDSVVAVADDVSKLPESLPERVGVVVQTTQSQQCVDTLVAELERRCREVRVEKTVCFATQERQHAAVELAKRVDVMVVIGGRNSGNTRRLYELCKPQCPKTFHIESENELEPSWFEGAESVGITAGASTPDEHIEAVRSRICEL